MAKNNSRREFIETGIKAGLVLPALSLPFYSCNPSPEGKKSKVDNPIKKLSILILGGTSFLGPHQIAYALGRGHSISTFTRGKTKPSVYPELFEKVEQLIGDRKDNLIALHNRKWDVVIDNSGRDAQWTKDTATLLKDNCELYLYTSSTGVYYPYLTENVKEDFEVLLEEPAGITDEMTKAEYGYGVMKANSEQEAIKQFGKERTIVVRPTYMIGPADKTNRFIHWPTRLKKGGEILVPGKDEDLVQYIDVRDVAEWMIRLIETKNTGTFNAVGPTDRQNMQEFIAEASKAFDVQKTFVKVDDYDFLKENGIFYIVPWIMPSDGNEYSAGIDNTKGIANGLTFRPLTKTMQNTLDWWKSDAVTKERRDEFEKDPQSLLAREAEVLERWKAL